MWLELNHNVDKGYNTFNYASLDNTKSDPWENREPYNAKTRDIVERES
jgi:hypothetical protein